MEVTCPSCSSKFNLPDKLAKPGAKLRCSVCNNVFQLPGSNAAPKRTATQPAPKKIREKPVENGLLPEMLGRKKSGFVKWLVVSVLVAACMAAGSYWWINREEEKPVEDVAKKVEMLTMRNVRQYNLMNEKIGKVFVIEGKVVNEFPEPRDFIKLEGAIYDKDKNTLAVKQQLAGAQLSLFQLQVLGEAEMDSFLNNKVEILANNTNVPPGGEVPFMILFYAPPDNVAEFGVKIVDVKKNAVK